MPQKSIYFYDNIPNYSNYVLLKDTVLAFIVTIFQALTSSVGNLGAETTDPQKKEDVFNTIKKINQEISDMISWYNAEEELKWVLKQKMTEWWYYDYFIGQRVCCQSKSGIDIARDRENPAGGAAPAGFFYFCLKKRVYTSIVYKSKQ